VVAVVVVGVVAEVGVEAKAGGVGTATEARVRVWARVRRRVRLQRRGIVCGRVDCRCTGAANSCRFVACHCALEHRHAFALCVVVFRCSPVISFFLSLSLLHLTCLVLVSAVIPPLSVTSVRCCRAVLSRPAAVQVERLEGRSWWRWRQVRSSQEW
jgi:hypothetical protein